MADSRWARGRRRLEIQDLRFKNLKFEKKPKNQKGKIGSLNQGRKVRSRNQERKINTRNQTNAAVEHDSQNDADFRSIVSTAWEGLMTQR